MPIAHLYILEGRDTEKKGHLIAEVTGAIQRALGAPRESIRVVIQEMPKAHFGIGGKSAEEAGR
jgi:4-oxalocrotonate tautomerase